MRQVAIVGLGRFGTRLAEQLGLDRACDRILLWNRSRPKLTGTLLSLKAWGEIIESPVQFAELDWRALDDVEIVVIAVKERYDPRDLLQEERLPRWLPRELRYVGLSRDIHLTRDTCSRLADYRGVVLVVTNPVDVMTGFVHEWLPKATVLGVGLTLDEARLSQVIARDCAAWRAGGRLPLGGEHGSGMVPLLSMLRPRRELARVKERLPEFLERTADIGVRIVGDLGFTVQDCAVVFARDIAWLLARESSEYRSFSMWRNQMCIGWPVRFAGGKLGPVEGLSPEEVYQITARGERVAAVASHVRRDWL